MKKLLKIILILVIIIVLPILIIYFTLMDSKDDAPVDLYNESITIDGEVTKLLDSALSGTDQMLLTLSEDDFNLLLFAVIRENINSSYYNSNCETCKAISTITIDSSIPVVGGKEVTINNAYVTLNENNIQMKITIIAPGIKTSVNMSLDFESIDGQYKLIINKLRLGNLNLLSGLGKSILNQVLPTMGINEDSINQYFIDGKIPFTFSLEDYSFNFNKKDLVDYLFSNLTSSNTELSSIITNFGSLLGSPDNQLVDIGFYEINEEMNFGVKLNLSEIKYDSEVDGIPVYQLDYELYKEKMLSVASQNELDNYDVVSKFIIYGYNDLTDSEKTQINVIDFSSISISDVTSYIGILGQSDIVIEDEMADLLSQELSDLSDNYLTVNISENLINQVLYTSGLIGTGYTNTYDINNTKKIITIGIEAIWLDVENDKLGFKILLNLNNVKLCLFTSFTNSTPNSSKIEADFSNLRLGSINFDETMKESILSLLSSIVTNSSMNFIAISNNKIIIDSNQFVDQLMTSNTDSLSKLIEIAKTNNLLTIDLTGSNLNDNGNLVLEMNLVPFTSQSSNLENEINEIKVPFDTTTFIKNKTQTFLISSLSSTENKIVFTQNDFERLLYTNTNGFVDFKNTTMLPDGVTEFSFSVDGILLEFTPSVVTLRFAVSINNMQSELIILGDVTSSTLEDEVYITLRNTVIIGSVETDADFLFTMLGNNLNNLGVMTYDSTTHRFTISSNSFGEFMKVGGTSTPLSVLKIRIVEGALEVIVTYTDPALTSAITTVTNVMETVLGNNFIDTTTFDTTDPSQSQAITDLTNTLSSISLTLSNSDPLTNEQTNALIDSINQLSDENQQEFLAQLETEANSNELLSLYNQLFGN